MSIQENLFKEEFFQTKPRIVSISLFSGCGGLDVASFLSGIPVVFSTDFNSDCIETLKINKLLDNTFVVKKDISELSRDVVETAISSFCSRVEPGTSSACDIKTIVMGGPPCQPFSTAGKRRGIKDPRSLMIEEFTEKILKLKPDAFLFENVESILHPKNRVVVEKFVETMSWNGFSCKAILGNSLDYGVPQKRKRLFILGTKGVFKSPEPLKTHCSPENVLKTRLKPYVNVGDVINGFDTSCYFEKEEVVTGLYQKELIRVPPGKNYLALTAERGCKNPAFESKTRFWSFLLKLSPELPSWTITAQPGTWTGPFHWNNRRLRVPEIAAIQSFPRWYKFYGNRRSVQQQIGNAVPPLMGKAMLDFLKESLF